MRVINQGGYLHEHISRLRLEENCKFTGRRKIFHRIWGLDDDIGYELVLDWGIDLDQVKDAYRKMDEQLRAGSREVWNCPRCGLIKEKEDNT